MTDQFKGLWPAMLTPVDDSGAPELKELEKLVGHLIAEGIDGLYLLGSTGQGVLFTEEQRKKVAEVVCAVNAGQLPVIVQVGSLTTAESVRLARHAAQVGADGISSVGPIYFSGPAAMALGHYRTIAQATDLPFFPYQLGERSIPGDTFAFVDALMEIPTVQGMKLTTNNLLEISTIFNHAGERLKLFSGSDELLCHASLCGTVGAIGSMYNLWGSACRHILTAFVQGDYQLTKRFMLCFQEVVRIILPDIWTFLRAGMLMKYQVDIGQSVAPLGNSCRPWDEARVQELVGRIDAFIP